MALQYIMKQYCLKAKRFLKCNCGKLGGGGEFTYDKCEGHANGEIGFTNS